VGWRDVQGEQSSSQAIKIGRSVEPYQPLICVDMHSVWNVSTSIRQSPASTRDEVAPQHQPRVLGLGAGQRHQTESCTVRGLGQTDRGNRMVITPSPSGDGFLGDA
jgi:hypothetical protein